MKQDLLIWLCLPAIILQGLLVKELINEKEIVKEIKEVPQAQAVEKTVDNRVDKLTCFFDQYGSVLSSSADTFITAADKNNIDYRVIAAISFVESTACKHHIEGTNNCWGWGHGRIVFKSYDEAINVISERLAVSNYYRKWQADKEDYWKLAVVYNGGDQVKWHKDVVKTMEEIKLCR